MTTTETYVETTSPSYTTTEGPFSTCSICDYVKDKLASTRQLGEVCSRQFQNIYSQCAATHMLVQYVEMRLAKCKGCDKYFHCKANYNAVTLCWWDPLAKPTAWAISECRELLQGYNTQDAMEDRAANDLGRSGGDCEAAYLCTPPVPCAWSISARTCDRVNCP